MTVLRDIGASGAGTSLSDYVSRERFKQNEMDIRSELAKARSEMYETRSELNRNQILNIRQQSAEENRLIPFETLKNRARVPSVGNYKEQLARELGFINPDGTIKVAHAKELQSYLSLPMHLTNISQMRVAHARDEYQTLVKASKDPEFAKKNGIKTDKDDFKEQLMAAEFRYKQAVGSDAGLQNMIKNELAKAQFHDAAKIAQEKLGRTDRSLDIQQDRFEADVAYKNAMLDLKERELQAAQSGTTGEAEKQGLKDASTLRKEFNTKSNDFIKVRDAYGRILAAAEPPVTGAGDLALIFNYMKVLDPGSVVRESEFATAETSREMLTDQGVPTFIINLREKIFKGGRLNPKQRGEFVDRSKMLYDRQLKSHEGLRREYGRLAKRYKTDPENVVVNYIMDLNDIKKSAKQQGQVEELLNRYGITPVD